MDLPADQIEEVKQMYGEVARADEGGLIYLLLHKLPLPVGCDPALTDALFCTLPRDGYESRLYFPAKVHSPTPRNWNGEVRILDRIWYAFSWRMNASGLRLAQMIQMHIAGLR